jgi:hypothetical protein
VSVGEEITIVSLVCQDLAETDEIADVIRSVGPTVVFTVLLDGPQLASRWAARYASVFADDPGSVVLTLTSFGMAQRSRPPGREVSAIVALLKDADQGFREIPLEPGAHAVLLTASGSRAIRRTADGRRPVDTGTHYFGAAVHQIHAPDAGSKPSSPDAAATLPRVLDVDDLTVLTGWAEGWQKPWPTPPSTSRDWWPMRARAPPGDPHSGSQTRPRSSKRRSRRSAP